MEQLRTGELSCLLWQVIGSERLAVHNLPAIVTMLHCTAHALDHLHGKGLIHGAPCPCDDRVHVAAESCCDYKVTLRTKT